jgi:aminoglycoside phosphotransferase (APT) family kinase protein
MTDDRVLERHQLLIMGLRSQGLAVDLDAKVEQIAAGRSNLTYRIEDGQHCVVLRTPPSAGATPSAHDVAREFRITSALLPTDVPVATPRVVCEDSEVMGVPFAVWDFVDGRVLRTRAQIDEADDAYLRSAVTDLIGVLARLHRVDPIAIGLGDFVRQGSYAARQLRRWTGQWAIVGDPRLQPLVEEIVTDLGRDVPSETEATLVHGDYRIDNVLFTHGAEPRVSAVLDWELATIGEATADVAMMCAYRDSAFDQIAGEPTAWASHRLPDVLGLAAAYERESGTRLRHWRFHLALAYFKVGVIAAGIDHRFRAGAASGPGFDTSGAAVERFFDLSLATLRSPE